MKPILAYAAVAVLAGAATYTPAHAQVLGPGPGAGQTGGQPSGVSSSGAGVFGGQVGTPLGNPNTAPGVNIGAEAATKGPPDPGADPARGAINNPTALDARAQAKGAVNDSQSLNPGNAQSDASAKVATELAAGLTIRGDGGSYGSIVRVDRDRAGSVTSVVVKAPDGSLRRMPAADLSLKGGVAVTARSQAEFNALPTTH